MAYAWLKLHHDVISDVRLCRFTVQEKWAYVVLMVLASSGEERGLIEADDEDLAHQCSFGSPQDFLYYKDKLRAKGLIEFSPGGIRITNWEARQGKSPSDSPEATRERKRKQRAKTAAKIGGQNTDAAVETLVSHEDVTRCHEDVTRQTRSEETRSDQKRLDQNLSSTPLPREEECVKRPANFVPTPDNFSTWETTYRLNRVPHNSALYHYDLQHLADGADRRGIPKWKPETIEGVKTLARKGRLGTDRKETAMADHEAAGYLSKRLSQLRSHSSFESAVGDLETAYSEGVALLASKQETEAKIKSSALDSEPAKPNLELRAKNHAAFLAYMDSLSTDASNGHQAARNHLQLQSHASHPQSGLNGGYGAVEA
jgi:hypothetical protein